MNTLIARVAALLTGAVLAAFAHFGLEATPALHAAVQGWAEATVGVLVTLAPLVYREFRQRREVAE